MFRWIPCAMLSTSIHGYSQFLTKKHQRHLRKACQSRNDSIMGIGIKEQDKVLLLKENNIWPYPFLISCPYVKVLLHLTTTILPSHLGMVALSRSNFPASERGTWHVEGQLWTRGRLWIWRERNVSWYKPDTWRPHVTATGAAGTRALSNYVGQVPPAVESKTEPRQEAFTKNPQRTSNLTVKDWNHCS